MLALFATLASRGPDSCVGWRAGAAVSHGVLERDVRAWTALARRTPGQNIALFHDDSLVFGAALLGAWQAGKTVWLAADTLPATCAALHGSTDAFWGQYPAEHAPGAPAAGDLCSAPWREPGADFPALVLHTSGSTGAPKSIPKQFAQVASELAALEEQFGAAIGAVAVLATVSHQHIYGLLFRVLWPLYAARPLYAHADAQPEALAPALAQRPCMLVASPAHLKRLPDHLDWSGAAHQLRAVFSSGGALESDASMHAGALLGRAPLEVYGSSESGGVAWRQGGAVWHALPGVAWRIEEGRLAVTSPQAGGELVLDDLAAPGAGGFVLQGRSDRIVKIEEKRISLDALEAALSATGLVREARVIALPAQAGARQALAAVAVLTAAGQAMLDTSKMALNAHLRGALAVVVEAVALPRRWRYVEQLPVNAQGKTTQAQLLALFDAPPDATL